MKIFKLMAIALVAMLGLNSCSKDCDHEFIDIDHSADLVGTWTCLQEGYAEALVIKADGSAVSTGVENREYWENVAGTIVVKNGTVTMTFEDNDNFKGHFDIIPGVAFSIFTEEGEHMTYYYCANDLADEIVGMWVSSDTPTGSDEKMTVQIYKENGKAIYTGFGSYVDEYVVNKEADYKVVGDLLFYALPKEALSGGMAPYITNRLTYSPDANAFGDIMSQKTEQMIDGKVVVATSTMLRIKQSLDLAGQKYDYIKTYVSNVKGEDKDINFMGYTFNFAKMDGSGLDKMLKALLFAVEFPNANKLTYSYQLNNNTEAYDAKIVVEGNKMTIKMSEKVATLKDVVLYAFQDADCSQLHFYMHRDAFVNFHTNMQAKLMESMDEQFDINNAEAVNAIYNEINNAVETINVSLVMSK